MQGWFEKDRCYDDVMERYPKFFGEYKSMPKRLVDLVSYKINKVGMDLL